MLTVLSPLDRVEELGRELTAELLRVGTAQLDLDGLQRARSASLRLRGAIDVFDIDLARRAAALRPAGGDRGVDEAMNPGGRAPAGKEKSDTTRGEVASAIPGVDDAMRSGALGAEYLDAIARARHKLTDVERTEFDRLGDDLASAAEQMTLHRFKLHVQSLAEQVQVEQGAKLAARQKRDRTARRWEDPFTGMRKLSLSVDPETGARVDAAVHAQVERMLRERRDDPTDTRTMEQLTADAIVELILNGNQHLRPGSTELVVLIDYLTLSAGLHDHSVHEAADGTHLSPDTIRRIACDSHVIPIVLGGPSELLDAGRRERTANRAQRRALRAIYRTCAIEGCTTPFHRCDMHHIIPWWRHGNTDVANLVPLCTRHHHMVHESGWQLSLDPANRQLTIRHPNGRVAIQPPPEGLTPPRLSPSDIHDCITEDDHAQANKLLQSVDAESPGGMSGEHPPHGSPDPTTAAEPRTILPTGRSTARERARPPTAVA